MTAPPTATIDDIRHAYRLLLGREPDEAGFEGQCAALQRTPTTSLALARSFLQSQEYQARNNPMPVAVDLGGFTIYVRLDDLAIGKHIHASHRYEPHVESVLREKLGTGDTFVDIGANIGFFSNLAAHLVGPTGVVVAIEPMDKNVQLIYRSIERNGFKNVFVHACAAGDSTAIVRMASGPRTSNGQMLVDSTDNMMLSQSIRLDDLLPGLPRLNVVKFDIEGFESRAWAGFEQALARHRPVVLTEFHPWCMRTYARNEPADYLQTLFDYGEFVEVLTQPGERRRCRSQAEVFDVWSAVDKRMRGGDGKSHLDLLVEPRR